MNPWLVYPTWGNFSSLFREVTMATDERHAFLKSHHLTTSLYFAINFLEALLNEEYRRRLVADGKSEEDILTILRTGGDAVKPTNKRGNIQKFTDWPSLICQKPVTVSAGAMKLITQFNDIRGNLTHPKSNGYEIYNALEKVNGIELLEAVAEYAVAVYAGLGVEYPYWLFGWNYLNPPDCGYDPTRISNQQFLHSLEYLGLRVHAFDAAAADAWRKKYMKDFKGYLQIAKFLSGCRECEPFDPNYAFRPRLARRWWDKDILERNKEYVVKRVPPIFFGRATVSPMWISPMQPVRKTSSAKK
jgi:hypothetical protein